jgi:hypothetical protein
MTIGPAGNTNVSPQNYGGVPPKQEQGEFKAALNAQANSAPAAAPPPPSTAPTAAPSRTAAPAAPPPPGTGPAAAPGTAPTAAAPAAAPVNPNLVLATSLVKTGGSGTAEDAKLVAESLAKLPKSTLEQMQKNGTKVIACRGSVTDYRTDLKGVQPRGWPPGSTWDKVPGANTRDKNEVVIAVTGHGTPAGAHVPKTGEGHGSVNLAAHEATHSIDSGSPSPSDSDDFKKARDADMAKLPAYEKQAGEAGRQETYAESAARHAEGKDAHTPNLKKYWDDRR